VDHPVVSDPTDYKGLPFAKGTDSAVFLPFGNLNKLIHADKPLTYFFDDLGQSPVAVQAACMQLLLARRINGHKVSEHVTFIAATNRRSDRAGVTGMLEPVKSRFVTIVELESDPDAWVAWALQEGLPTELISFIRFRPDLLDKFEPTNELTNSPCPRTVHNIGKLMLAGIPRKLDSGPTSTSATFVAPTNMTPEEIRRTMSSEFEIFSGAAGAAFATEFCGFLRIYRSLPNLDVILTNPDRAAVPTDPAVLYALCGALTYRAGENNLDRIVKYAGRIAPEFSVKLMADIITKDQHLAETRAYIQWATDNSELLM
jgi:hypothetical protein